MLEGSFEISANVYQTAWRYSPERIKFESVTNHVTLRRQNVKDAESTLYLLPENSILLHNTEVPLHIAPAVFSHNANTVFINQTAK